MSRRDNGYDYSNYNRYEYRQRRESVGDKIKEAIGSTVDNIASLFPKKNKYRDSGYNYYSSYDRDYSYGRIRRKDSITPAAIAGRVVVAGAVLAGMGAAWFNRDTIVDVFQSLPQRAAEAFSPNESDGSGTSTSTPEPIKTATREPSPTSTPEPTATKKVSEFYVDNEWGVKIKYNQEGMPLSYDVNGNETFIDKEELKRLQEKAKSEGLPQLVFYANAPNSDSIQPNNSEGSLDRPKIEELPQDVLSEEELADRGITIIQGEKVKLHLRESAFSPGSSLDSFKPGGENKLTIVLVDGPSVSGAYMKDPKYKDVVGIVGNVDTDIEKYRQEQIDHWKRFENSLATELKEKIAANDTDWIETIRGQYINTIVKQEELRKAPVESLAVEAGMTEAAGLYSPISRVAFVSVGESQQDSSKTKIMMYVDEKGEIKVTNMTSLSGSIDYVPESSQSFPRPADFHYLAEHGEDAPTEFPDRLDRNKVSDEGYSYGGFSPDNPMHYPYRGQMPSQVLRHELTHDEKMNAYPTRNYMLDRSEWWTDMQTMGDINEAFLKFQESGYEDNSLYWLIFEVDGKLIFGNTTNQTQSAM
jgi:hypothetical protein